MAVDEAAHVSEEKQKLATQNHLASWLEQGLAMHRCGQLDVARKFYQQILEVHPEHADAQHLFGVTAH